jgi:hypothetical protein
MLLRLPNDFAPSRPHPSPELERLRADVTLASAAAIFASATKGEPERPDGEPAHEAGRTPADAGPERRSRRRRHAFDLDPRLRAADLRAQERALARRR